MDFLSRLLRKSPAKDMFSSASSKDQDLRQNTSGSNETQSAPLAVPSQPKVSDESDSSLEYGSADEDSAHQEDSLINALNNFNITTPKIEKNKLEKEKSLPAENSLNPPVIKQKVFNIVTETFDTPDASFTEDLNSSDSGNQDNLEIGQDPLNVTITNETFPVSPLTTKNTNSIETLTDTEPAITNISIDLSQSHPANISTSLQESNHSNFDSQSEGIAIIAPECPDNTVSYEQTHDATFEISDKELNVSQFIGDGKINNISINPNTSLKLPCDKSTGETLVGIVKNISPNVSLNCGSSDITNKTFEIPATAVLDDLVENDKIDDDGIAVIESNDQEQIEHHPNFVESQNIGISFISNNPENINNINNSVDCNEKQINGFVASINESEPMECDDFNDSIVGSKSYEQAFIEKSLNNFTTQESLSNQTTVGNDLNTINSAFQSPIATNFETLDESEPMQCDDFDESSILVNNCNEVHENSSFKQESVENKCGISFSKIDHTPNVLDSSTGVDLVSKPESLLNELNTSNTEKFVSNENVLNALNSQNSFSEQLDYVKSISASKDVDINLNTCNTEESFSKPENVESNLINSNIEGSFSKPESVESNLITSNIEGPFSKSESVENNFSASNVEESVSKLESIESNLKTGNKEGLCSNSEPAANNLSFSNKEVSFSKPESVEINLNTSNKEGSLIHSELTENNCESFLKSESIDNNLNYSNKEGSLASPELIENNFNNLEIYSKPESVSLSNSEFVRVEDNVNNCDSEGYLKVDSVENNLNTCDSLEDQLNECDSANQSSKVISFEHNQNNLNSEVSVLKQELVENLNNTITLHENSCLSNNQISDLESSQKNDSFNQSNGELTTNKPLDLVPPIVNDSPKLVPAVNKIISGAEVNTNGNCSSNDINIHDISLSNSSQKKVVEEIQPRIDPVLMSSIDKDKILNQLCVVPDLENNQNKTFNCAFEVDAKKVDSGYISDSNKNFATSQSVIEINHHSKVGGSSYPDSEIIHDDFKEKSPLECDMLNTDIDDLESDSDTLSVCSSINPLEINPFETRCKIANSPERDFDNTLTPYDSNAIVLEDSVHEDCQLNSTLTFENATPFKKPQVIKEKNIASPLKEELSSTVQDFQNFNKKVSPFKDTTNIISKMSSTNNSLIKNSPKFKDNLERINDSGECNENYLRAETVVQVNQSFVTPMCRDQRVNNLTMKNNNVKILSPMSRTGDLLELNSPVQRDNNVSSVVESVKHGCDLLTGDDSFHPATADDFGEEVFDTPVEFFKDPAAFDYLQLCGSTTAESQLYKESLLLKFDPLVGAQRGTLPTGIRPGRGIPAPENLPPPPPPPKLEEDAATISGLVESCSSDSSICTSSSDQGKTLGTMSSMEQSLSALSLHSQQQPTVPQSNIVNVTPTQNIDKPTQVVSPAINTRQQYPSTPLSSKNNQTPAKSVTSALAVIDRLISLGGTPPPPPVVVVQPKEPDMDPRLMSELQSVRELLARQEEELRLSEEKSTVLQRQLTEAVAREETLIDRINEKNRDHRQMDIVMEEYERTMSQLIGEREMEKKQWSEERAAIIRERDETLHHLNTMEQSFNDIHVKYERCKAMIQAYKTNEEALKETVRTCEEASKKQIERYEQLRQHAMSQLEIANQEIDSVKKSSQAEVTKLNAMLKKSEFLTTSLQETLTQKLKDIEELTAICDELIQKVG